MSQETWIIAAPSTPASCSCGDDGRWSVTCRGHKGWWPGVGVPREGEVKEERNSGITRRKTIHSGAGKNKQKSPVILFVGGGGGCGTCQSLQRVLLYLYDV